MVFRITRCPMCLGLGVVRFEEFCPTVCPTCRGQGTVNAGEQTNPPAASYLIWINSA
jgi:hypothetical protein